MDRVQSCLTQSNVGSGAVVLVPMIRRQTVPEPTAAGSLDVATMAQIVQMPRVAIATVQQKGTGAVQERQVHGKIGTAWIALCSVVSSAAVPERTCRSEMGKEATAMKILSAPFQKYAITTSLIQALRLTRAPLLRLDAAQAQRYLKMILPARTAAAAPVHLDAVHFPTTRKQLAPPTKVIVRAVCMVAVPERTLHRMMLADRTALAKQPHLVAVQAQKMHKTMWVGPTVHAAQQSMLLNARAKKLFSRNAPFATRTTSRGHRL